MKFSTTEKIENPYAIINQRVTSAPNVRNMVMVLRNPVPNNDTPRATTFKPTVKLQVMPTIKTPISKPMPRRKMRLEGVNKMRLAQNQPGLGDSESDTMTAEEYKSATTPLPYEPSIFDSIVSGITDIAKQAVSAKFGNTVSTVAPRTTTTTTGSGISLNMILLLAGGAGIVYLVTRKK